MRQLKATTEAGQVGVLLAIDGLQHALVRVVSWPQRNERAAIAAMRGLTPPLRGLGFAVIRARDVPNGLPGERLAQRHVAMWMCGRADRRAAGRAFRLLAGGSIRAPLAIDLSPRREVLGPSPRIRASDYHRVETLAAEGDWAAANTWLAAWWSERACLGRPESARLQQLAQGIRARSGRYGSAEPPAPQRIRTLPNGDRRDSMIETEALAALLRISAEADDELTTLVEGARWVRGEIRATIVAWVNLDGRVVASDGAHDARLWSDEADACRRAEVAAWLQRPDAWSYVCPVKYASAVIGSVAIRTSADRRSVTEALGATLAAVGASALRARLDEQARQTTSSPCPEIVGTSPAMVALVAAVARAASTNYPVLIEGESGTGKELVARALHRLGPRRDRRCVAFNCAAIPDELADAELFGYSRGAFTGAVAARTGLFEEARGGTIFLDEVGELSAKAQAKLLRVLQEGEVRRLGESVTRSIDARVVSATNRGLGAMVERGEFRADLVFRLAVVRLTIPPLRDRTEDIPALARRAWDGHLRETQKRAILGPDALARLTAHSWPGNVRELQNVMAGLALAAPARGRVSARHVDEVLRATGQSVLLPVVSLERARLSCERRTVAAALARHQGRRASAARELGLSRQGLTKALKRLQLGDDAPEAGVA